MPRSDHFPPDIMDKHAAFAGAIVEYLRLALDWEIRRFNPNQPRVPAGRPDGGQWSDGNGGDHAAEQTPTALMPRSDAPQAFPTAATEDTPRFQISLRPADITKPNDPLLSEAARNPSTAMLVRQLETIPTYFAMYSVPVFLDPTVGFPRSTDTFFIGSADMTRLGVPYVEAHRFDTFKGNYPFRKPTSKCVVG